MSDEKEESGPRIARFKPYYFKPVPGRTYLWCSCGRSANQPFCDGSHKGTGFEPVAFKATQNDKEVLLCGCKHSRSQPFCDGSHNNLRATYDLDDPQSEENRNKVQVTHNRDGRFELNGECYVGRIGKLPSQAIGNVLWSPVVTNATGAKYQSMFFMAVTPGLSPVVSFDGPEVILFIAKGWGEITIAGRPFPIRPRDGVYVRQGESFRINNPGEETISVYLSVCPQAAAPVFGRAMLENFDASEPRRVVPIDPDKHQPMADRTFQLLVNKDVGSRVVTQFIGTIPCSKAAPHRHLYEEALLILSGSGTIWTEDLKANVLPGDVVFLPSKQMHSLQCTDPAGMEIVGVIYPGGNPDINF
jgi:CDGSH-type Zn-finger protein/quercetin dioxygenase-like cupin family protein